MRGSLSKFLMLVLAIFFLPHYAMGEKVQIGNGDWSPYQSKSLKQYGFASEIVTEAFKSQGVEVEYKFYPWARSMKLAQSGKLAGTFLWGYKKEREEDFYFSDPIVDISYVFFYLKSNDFDWKGVSDLEGKKIGATVSYSYGKDFDEARKNNLLQIDEAPKDSLNFEKLVKGRIDIFPNDLDAGLDILRKNHPKDFNKVAYHKKSLRETPHYLLVSKKHPKAKEILEAFNKGLKEIRAAGKYDQIVKASRENK